MGLHVLAELGCPRLDRAVLVLKIRVGPPAHEAHGDRLPSECGPRKDLLWVHAPLQRPEGVQRAAGRVQEIEHAKRILLEAMAAHAHGVQGMHCPCMLSGARPLAIAMQCRNLKTDLGGGFTVVEDSGVHVRGAIGREDPGPGPNGDVGDHGDAFARGLGATGGVGLAGGPGGAGLGCVHGNFSGVPVHAGVHGVDCGNPARVVVATRTRMTARGGLAVGGVLAAAGPAAFGLLAMGAAGASGGD
jgi:hypothetical protein